MSKVGCILLLVVIWIVNTPAKAFWFDIPSSADTLTRHGTIEEIQRELDPENINVLVWNIYKGGLLSWNIDLERYARHKDIVILQEGILNDAMRAEFDASKKLQYSFATSFVFKTSGHATGVVTGATLFPSDVIYQRSKGREIIGFTPKMVLLTKYPIRESDKELLVINIHALNTVSWKRVAAQILDALRVAKDHDGPVIFAGDFNTWSRKKEAFAMRAMARAGFTNVDFHNGHERMSVFGRYLDYIFVRGLAVKNSRVISEATGSDHKPLSANLKIIDK